MNSAKVLFRRVAYATAVMAMATNACFATPLNNPYDTQPLYTYYCSDKFYKNRDKGEIRIHISPFYQSASKARDTNGTKVAGGDRLGKWNMIGVLFDALKGYGTQTTPLNIRYTSYLAPATKPFPVPMAVAAVAPGVAQVFGKDPTKNLDIASTTDYPNMYNALGSVVEVTSQDNNAASRYRIGSSRPYDNTAGTQKDGSNLTEKQYFNPDQHTFAYVSVPVSYEKIGVRSQINFDFGFGLGVSVKGGVVDVKQRAKRFELESALLTDLGQPNPKPLSSLDAVVLYDNLLSPAAIEAVLGDVDISTNTFQKTALEDLHLQIYWHVPVDSFDKEGNVAVTMIPYFAFGVWFPASDGVKNATNRIFAAPVGNNGYFGYTLDAAIALDFPMIPRKEQTFQIAMGAGLAFYNERDLGDQRFPSSSFQQGPIPWKIHIKQRPGTTWYLNASAKSEHFVDNFSIYLDYIYTQHLKDKVTLIEPDDARRAAFMQGYDRYRDDTVWQNQQVQVGLNYDLTDSISISGAAQGQIAGVQVMRSVTVMGGLNVTF